MPATTTQLIDDAAAPLARDAAATLAEQLAARVADRIAQRLLAPGARLPSVREAARRHGLSPGTVVGAYDLLQARGLVQAQPQRGFYVREPRAAARARDRGHAGARAPPAPVDATALIRSMFQAQGGLPAPGMGTLPRTGSTPPLLQRALRRACATPEAWLRYGDPAGDPALRDALSHRLADLGIAARRRRSSPPSARRRRSTSSAARCCSRATRCWSTSPAGRSSTRG